MFDLGMQELIVIFVVALLVFGPKKLPELSRTLGKGMREIKSAMRGIKESLDEAEDQIEEEIQSAKKEIGPLNLDDTGADREKSEPESEHTEKTAPEPEPGKNADAEGTPEKAD